jgi:hypothetical protein
MAQTKEERNEKVKALTEKLEAGVRDVFTSGKFEDYLRTMSRFHHYSSRNSMLIWLQNSAATHVAGFNDWKKKFERTVKKGEHGLQILAPMPYKVGVKRVDEHGQPVLDDTGKPIVDVTEQCSYRAVYVFDVAQTEGKPLPEITRELTGNVQRYNLFLDALRETSPAPMSFEDIEGGARGFYSYTENRIAVQEGMSEAQTLKTFIHEIAHATLHKKDDGLTREEKEVQAESTAFTVCAYFGLDTSDYSLGYVAGWSEGKELKELQNSLDIIRNASNNLIETIDGKIEQLAKERGIDLTEVLTEQVITAEPIQAENFSEASMQSVQSSEFEKGNVVSDMQAVPMSEQVSAELEENLPPPPENQQSDECADFINEEWKKRETALDEALDDVVTKAADKYGTERVSFVLENSNFSSVTYSHLQKLKQAAADKQFAEIKEFPFYKNSLDYAIEKGEAQLFHQSQKLNEQCAEYVRQLYAENISLNPNLIDYGSIVKQAAEKYGAERVLGIVATEIAVNHSDDGRIDKDIRSECRNFSSDTTTNRLGSMHAGRLNYLYGEAKSIYDLQHGNPQAENRYTFEGTPVPPPLTKESETEILKEFAGKIKSGKLEVYEERLKNVLTGKDSEYVTTCIKEISGSREYKYGEIGVHLYNVPLTENMLRDFLQSSQSNLIHRREFYNAPVPENLKESLNPVFQSLSCRPTREVQARQQEQPTQSAERIQKLRQSSYSPQILQKARAANLKDFFERNGYTCEKSTGGEYHVRGFGGLYVNPDKGVWKCFSADKGGHNSVDCIQTMLNTDFKTAVSYLVGATDVTAKIVPSVPTPQKERTVFTEPEHAPNIKRIYAYLCITRELDPKLVSKLISEKKLYQDKNNNCVFVHQDKNGNAVGAEIQGTLSEKRYKGVAEGTHDTVFEISYAEKGQVPKKVYAFESAIDLLSFRQMSDPEKLKDCALVSMAGLKYEAIRPYVENGAKVFSCVDNDEAGKAFNAKHDLKTSPLLEKENVKDYNDLLKKRNEQAGIKPAFVSKTSQQKKPEPKHSTSVKH